MLAAALAAAALAAALAAAKPGGTRVLWGELQRARWPEGLLQQLGTEFRRGGRVVRYQGGGGASLRAAPVVWLDPRLVLRRFQLALLLIGEGVRDGRRVRQPALQRRAAAAAAAIAAAAIAAALHLYKQGCPECGGLRV